MKLSKSLLSALLVGISLQTVSSCGKEKLPEPKDKKEAKKEDRKPTVPGNCPACGMG